MYHPFSVASRDAASVNITTSYTQLVASVAQEVHGINIAYSANGAIILGIGAAAAEVDFIPVPSGTSTPNFIEVIIPAGARISIRTLSGTISAGTFSYTFFT